VVFPDRRDGALPVRRAGCWCGSRRRSAAARGSNISTSANDNFLDPGIPFADAPQAMKVEVCWKVNELGTGYKSVHVTARNGDGQLWSYELPGGQQGIIGVPAEDRRPAAPPPQRGEAQRHGQGQAKERRRSVLTRPRRLTGRKRELSPTARVRTAKCRRLEPCCASRGSYADSRRTRRRKCLRLPNTELSRIENGLKEPTAQLLKTAAEIFSVPVEFFGQTDAIYGAPISVHAADVAQKVECVGDRAPPHRRRA